MIDVMTFLRFGNHRGARKPARPATDRVRLRLDRLEAREMPSATWAFDFGTSTSPAAQGYKGVPLVAYSTSQHFGWQNLAGLSAIDRGAGDPLTRDFQTGNNNTFRADVANGSYDVVATLGDSQAAHDRVSVWAEGQLLASNVTTQAGQFLQVRGRVTVTDGQLNFRISDSTVNNGFALAALTISPVNMAATGLWDATATPRVASWNDASSVELGVRFQATSDGTISGIRFYKGVQNTGPHTGSLWSSDGTLLATAVFSGESASGWQQVNFSQPVAIKANTTYVASYHTNGYYAADNSYFAVSGQRNGLLYAPSTTEAGGNSVYRYGASGFPTSTYKASNYWVDVVFQQNTGLPTANSGPDKTGNEGSAVSFTGSASGTAPLTYQWNFGDGTSATGTLTPSHTYADNGSYTVTLTVTDASGQTAQDTAVVTVGNVAPTAALSNNGPVQANSAVTIAFSNPFDPSSADTAAGFRYSYDFNNDGTFELTDMTAASATTTYAAAGTYTARGRVKDKDGGFTDYTTSVTVSNPPTANAGPDKTGNEGSAIAFTGSASGTGTLTYRWDFGDGASATGTLAPSHVYADNRSYTVTLTVTNAAGQTAQDTAVVAVGNVAPTAALSNNGPAQANSAVTIAFSNQFDPSSADTTAGFKYSYDFNNDGTFELTDVTAASANTTYAAAGTYAVRGRIKDKDGSFTDYTTTVTVNNTSTGHTYYVSPTGSNTNNGTATSPWLTIQKAADSVQAGDTVIVRAGNFAGFILGWDTPTAGTASNPITFEADPTAAPGTVVINARNVNTPTGIDIEPGCDYITVMGFTIIGGGGIATYPNRGYGIKVTGNYDRVLNNTITNLDYGTAGIHDNGGDHVLIEGNTITGVHNHGNANLGHGIYVANADGVVIRGNIIHDNDYIGIHINGDPNVVSNALIENNRIYNNGQNGINADGLQNSTIRNNLIYGYASYGIALYFIDSSGPSKNNIIVNNTIVSTVSGAGAAVRMLDASTGNTLYNNVLLGGGGIAFRISSDSMSGLVSDYNVGGGLYQSEDTGATQTLVQWRTQTGQDAHSFISSALAIFVSPAVNDYHLKVGSLAIDAGTVVNAPDTDLDGNHRPRGSGIDIGAYEF